MNKLLLEAVLILFVVSVIKAQYGYHGHNDPADSQEGKHLEKLFDTESVMEEPPVVVHAADPAQEGVHLEKLFDTEENPRRSKRRHGKRPSRRPEEHPTHRPGKPHARRPWILQPGR